MRSETQKMVDFIRIHQKSEDEEEQYRYAIPAIIAGKYIADMTDILLQVADATGAYDKFITYQAFTLLNNMTEECLKAYDDLSKNSLAE